MDEQKEVLNEGVSDGYDYDAADRLFDFMGGEGGLTALVCESDPAVREKISEGLKGLDYQITTPDKAKEALKAMRFHVFDVVVVNELFDTTDPETNEVMLYLENLNMSTRRRFFVILVSDRYRTMDNLAAFNRSVNLIINLKNIEDAGKVIKQGLIDHRAFYHIFQETLQKIGKV